MDQIVECLPNKHEALISNSSTIKKGGIKELGAWFKRWSLPSK
jgi:hypothetical protein